ncbi:SCO1860 family LAETG-anchored protein [Streptomyces sp. ID05-47C]|uniref:SCO1860 family LAETG-anchored protein n=1 Tax=Streptomyces sp. ID05-47C TaxID=3028665 RepID=UPI0029BDD2EA|nr:SCO1860 family LAETG-anchored protein [Streptomyces sp. ID05-47C]MDX3570212.1 SCO1860 family LAETG-anchored protein [Streptomyces sp. ID05-47C]
MNGFNFRMPARRCATVLAATALAAGPAALSGAPSAHATDEGSAGAVVLRTGLDVALLDKTVDVPLAVSLNEVRAPQSAEKTALTVELDGVDGGRPISVLRADVAEAKATVEEGRAEASTRLAHAKLHVPGLPLLSLIEIEAVTSKAVCEAGKAPVATSSPLGAVTVLGKRVSVSAGGPTDVKVPGVGEVRLDLGQRETTSRTAAATALELTVSINPLNLNVAEVTGTVTLAEATCETPAAVRNEEAPSSAEPVEGVKAQGAPSEAGLAETGGSSMTPYVAGGAVALLAAGGAAVALTRRRG